MGTTARAMDRDWTADEFLRTDQHAFGDAWRYELVDGEIVAHAAPSPDHAAILAGLTAALGNRLRGNKNGCRPEAGSGAAPRQQQRPTARIPDATVRCGDLPRVVFDVVSPSELRACGPGTKGGGICKMSRASRKSSRFTRTRRRSTSIAGRTAGSGPSTPWMGWMLS